ncbi:MAG: hypothetical protein KGJ62_12650 [Armatimonadetes bacterium]|nr:hypothetical protein [Armatimonadota bacterium]MDE2207969.1 hypothetical protein [Armatimonadota bacterium]
MKRTVALCSAALLLLSAVAFAGPKPKAHKLVKHAKHVKVAKKLTDVWTCPIELDAASKTIKPVVFAGYRVHFCCSSCPAIFSKLTPAQKKAKILAALKHKSATKMG